MCCAVEYGVNQYIPAPLTTQVPESVTSNGLLFKKRTFADVNDDHSRIVSTAEAHKLFVRVQRLNELNYYADYLESHRAFQDKVAAQMEEPGGEDVTQVVDPITCNG